jgi:hypothetical protein
VQPGADEFQRRAGADVSDRGAVSVAESLLVSFATDGKGDVLERVESAINGFRGSREPFDDATMMAVRVG